MPTFVSLLNPSYDGWRKADEVIAMIDRGERATHPFGVANRTTMPIGSTLYVFQTGSNAGIKARGRSIREPYEAPRLEDPSTMHMQVDAEWFEVQVKDEPPALPRELLEADSITRQMNWNLVRGGLIVPDDVANRIAMLWPMGLADRTLASDSIAAVSAREGDLVQYLVTHRTRERSLRPRKLTEARLAGAGNLFCEACQMNMTDRFGDADERVAEVHHILPLSEATEGVITSLADLAVVCANCHGFIHSRCPLYSLGEARATLGGN